LVASINLANKTGELEEKITVETDTDEQNLLVRIVRAAPLSPTERRAPNPRKSVATVGITGSEGHQRQTTRLRRMTSAYQRALSFGVRFWVR
jgi:hypothetical protein